MENAWKGNVTKVDPSFDLFHNCLSGRKDSARFLIQTFFAFCDEMYRAGCTEFTINFGIPAMHAFIAHVDSIFLAGVAGFPIRVINAAGHR